MDLQAVLQAAANGDREAWNALVAQYSGLVWSVARAHRLGDADAADVVQTTWLRLVEHLDRIRNPEGVGAWLATTARHECLRVLRVGAAAGPDRRLRPAATSARDAALDARLLADERDAALWQAFARLGRALPDAAARAGRRSAAELRRGRRGAGHADRQHRPDPGACLEQLRAQARRGGDDGGAG